MSLSVKGQKCPICKSYMFDDDDIVFCPVCGVPSHRECYNTIKKCPLEEYHGTDMQYTAPEIKEEPIEEDQKPEPKEIPFVFGRSFEIDLYGGVKKTDQIAGVTAEEMKNTVGVNTQYYLPRFFKLNNKQKKSWNWAAFLFPQGFFLFRKCYKAGILAFLLSVASTALLNYPMLHVVINESQTWKEIFISVGAQLAQNPEILIFSFIATVLGLLIQIPMRVLFGIFGNWIYRKEVFEKIKDAKEQADEEPTLVMQLKGGVNPLLGVLGVAGVNWLVSILFMIL